LDSRIDHTVAEDTSEAEGRGAVACAAVDERDGVTAGLSGRTNAVAGIAPVTDNLGTGVVGVGVQKTFGGVTGAAFGARIGVRWSRRLAFGYRAVVAAPAGPGNPRVIKASIRLQFEEMNGVVAVIAFDNCCDMKFGLADGQNAVVTSAAVAKYFLMVNRVYDAKAQWRGRMAGRAHIAGSAVILRFTRNRDKLVAMTIRAVRGQPQMKYGLPGSNGGHDQHK